MEEYSSIINLGYDCFIDLELNVLVKDGVTNHLSITERRLLQKLANPMGKINTTIELYNYIWKIKTINNFNILYVLINRIRKKLEEDPRNPKCLITIRKKGYVLYPRKKT